MPTRPENIELICKFLRDRYEASRKVISATDALTESQRAAALTSADFARETKTEYTIKELAKGMKGILSYHQIRYALVGADPHPILTKQQPEELYTLGVKIDYRSGVHNPKFEYDPHVMYAHMTRKKENMDTPVTKPEAKPEPSLPEPAAPAESVTVAECNFKHLPVWVRTLIARAINADDVQLNEERQMLINNSPVVAVQYITADMLENDVPADFTAVVFDNTDYVTNEEGQP